jgi:hypothetical protein
MCFMMDVNLTTQPVVWNISPAPVAVLFCEDPAEITVRDAGGDDVSGLVSTVIANGLPWIQNVVELHINVAEGWQARMDKQHRLTIDWPAPHGRPLLIDVALNWPPGWIDAARDQEAVVLFCGANLGLTNQRDPTDHLVETAAAGSLAGGAVPYHQA